MANSKEAYKGLLGMPFRLDLVSDAIVKAVSYKKTIAGGAGFLLLLSYLNKRRQAATRRAKAREPPVEEKGKEKKKGESGTLPSPPLSPSASLCSELTSTRQLLR